MSVLVGSLPPNRFVKATKRALIVHRNSCRQLETCKGTALQRPSPRIFTNPIARFRRNNSVRILAFADPHSTESEKGRPWTCRHGLELFQLENITDSGREGSCYSFSSLN